MTSYVLTLVGDADLFPLEPGHVDNVRHFMAVSGRVAWLAENEACDLFFESPLTDIEITELARSALSGSLIDVVCTPVARRRKKLLIADMDSTVINQECIDELGDAFGVGARIREITTSVVEGKISFPVALRLRMALMKGLDYSQLERVYEDRISLKEGARILVQTMRQNGAHCILVSGGFTFFTNRIANRIGFHEHQANELVFENGRLTGEVHEPVLGRTAKLETLNRVCCEHNLKASDVLAVGDGANDIEMVEAAGLGVAFHGASALKARANARIDHGNLTALLYVQGFTKAQFVCA